MKIRNGFVSNSSSSSFVVIIGKRIDLKDITPELIKRNKIFVDTFIGGGEGAVGFYVDEHNFPKLIEIFRFSNQWTYIIEEHKIYGDSTSTPIKLNGEYDIICDEYDYHSEYFFDSYCDNHNHWQKQKAQE
jgi:hypothetical protein